MFFFVTVCGTFRVIPGEEFRQVLIASLGTALDRLADFYSPESPWVLLSVADLQAAHEQAPYDLLYLDKRPSTGAVPAGRR